MPAPRPVTDADRDAVRAGHTAGKSRNAIAREIGRSTWTVTKLGRELGLDWDRAATAAATAARVVDAKARRAQLALDLLGDAERLRRQLWEPCVVHAFGGKENTYAEHVVSEPPFADKRNIMASVQLAANTSARLVEQDSDDGATDARSMLGDLARGLTAAYNALDADEHQADDADGP
jgi:hypothetical protein